MALDLIKIREALVDQITTKVDGLTGYAYPPGAPMPPYVEVSTGEEYVNYHGTFSSGAVSPVQLVMTVGVPVGPDVDGQRVLDQYLSAGTDQFYSIIDALEADRTLGGVVADSHVSGASGHRLVNIGDTARVVAADLTIEILQLRS